MAAILIVFGCARSGRGAPATTAPATALLRNVRRLECDMRRASLRIGTRIIPAYDTDAMADPRATRILVWMCVFIAVNQLGFGAIVPVIALYAQSFGVLQAAIGVAIAVHGLARFLVAVPGGIGRAWGRGRSWGG